MRWSLTAQKCITGYPPAEQTITPPAIKLVGGVDNSYPPATNGGWTINYGVYMTVILLPQMAGGLPKMNNTDHEQDDEVPSFSIKWGGV